MIGPHTNVSKSSPICKKKKKKRKKKKSGHHANGILSQDSKKPLFIYLFIYLFFFFFVCGYFYSKIFPASAEHQL